MRKKLLYWSLAIVILFVVTRLFFDIFSDKNETKYQFATLSRGNMQNTISSSGVLSPVTTVEVGTQVSGTIAKLYADFNDHVKKGQLLAVLDTVLLKSAVLDAQANVEKAQAQLEEAQMAYDRNKKLFDAQMISDADFLPFKTNWVTQQANLKSARAALQRAERNLKYAVIRSPIAGIVTLRNVEAGQTVAASFSTPTLFKIAGDLSKMEILAEVDESDIGSIKDGQHVHFTVQAYPDKTFNGTVKQVRLEPTTVQNVVTYTVVVQAANPDNLLLPGMTATVDFITEEKNDVLMVPNSALRFKPDEKVLAEFREQRQKERNATADSSGNAHRGSFTTSSQRGFAANNGQRPKNIARLWYLNSNGKLAMTTVRTGMNDGTQTEILSGHNLQDGMQVISGNQALTSNSTNNNTQRQPAFGRRGF
jgi:HlyD family secretion protein